MKKVFMLSGALLLTMAVNAQQFNVRGKVLDASKIRNEFRSKLFNAPATAGKTTVIKQRLTGESNWSVFGINPVKTDSIRYRYSGSNGSPFYLGGVGFDYFYPPTITLNATAESYGLPPVAADSIKSWTLDSATQTLVLQEQVIAGYNANQTVNFYEDRFYGEFPDTVRIVNDYDGLGRVTTMNMLRWDYTAGAFDSSEKRVLSYNGLGKVAADTTFEYVLGDWEPYFVILHTFNAAGDETQALVRFNAGPAWLTVLQFDMSYYPDGKTKTFAMKSFNGSALINQFKDSSAYTTGVDFATSNWGYMWDAGSASWVNDTYTTLHLNAAQQPDTFYNNVWDASAAAWEPTSKVAMAYNSYGNPELRYTSFIMSGTEILDNIHYFWYELYNDISGTEDLPTATQPAVYPNPTQGNVTVSLEAADQQTAAVKMYNASGQLVLDKTLGAGERSFVLTTSQLPTGIYFMSFHAKDGSLTGQRKMIKN